MSWIALFLAAAGMSATLAAAAPAAVSGRCRDGRTWTTSIAEQGQMLGLLNQTRAAAAKPPVRRHAVLDRMAQAQAVDMACRNYFDHTNPERMKLQDRLKRVDDGSLGAWHRLAEIIGTSVTPRRQLDRWLASRGHRGAVLEEEHDLAGVGMVRIQGSRYGTYWAVTFAAAGRY